MNLFLMLLLFIIGISILWYELLKQKISYILIAMFIFIFVITVLSRIDNYYYYSDLGPYIFRFTSGDDSYFGLGYQIFTKIIRHIFGNYEIVLLISVSSLNILLALSTACLISLDEGANKYNAIKRDCSFIGSFLLLYTMYWGLSFSAEVIRAGIAISLSLFSIALLLKKKYFIFIAVYALSIAFHWTQIILLPILIIIAREEKYRSIHRKVFLIWMFFILFFDILNISYTTVGVLMPFSKFVLEILSLESHYSIYLEIHDRGNIFSYLTRQYVFYRVTGFFLIFGDLKNRKYNMFTFGYFVGLTMFTFFNALVVITRIQWIYLVLSIFAIYYFIKENNKISYFIRGSAVTIFMLLQTIMAALYLG